LLHPGAFYGPVDGTSSTPTVCGEAARGVKASRYNASMASDQKKLELFNSLRRSLKEAGLATVDPNSIICPLCWKETGIEQLRLEHAVPETLGGREVTLTCQPCNNNQGSKLESQLVNFQKSLEAFSGHGELEAKIPSGDGNVVAAFSRDDGGMHIRVIGKASNPAAQKALSQTMRSPDFSELKLQLNFNYRPDHAYRAVLRAAYLIAFHRFGYPFIDVDDMQQIRRLIVDGPTDGSPKLRSLVTSMHDALKADDDRQHYFCRASINGRDVLAVIIRLRCRTTALMCALLPNPGSSSAGFFQDMERLYSARKSQSVTFKGTFFV
jgi:hypothetical protein